MAGRARLINTLLAQTAARFGGEGPCAAKAGRPYAREAVLTPYEYTAGVSLTVEGRSRLDVLLSFPAAVLDAVCELGVGADDDGRAAALAGHAWALVEGAREACGLEGSAELPRVVVGSDVELPWLVPGTRRLCLPWETEVGSFVLEAAVV